jgi:hypothetical protein
MTHAHLVRKAFGKHGENYVATHLCALGYRARLGAIANTGDVVVEELLAVEVKSAYRTKRQSWHGYPAWQFSFHRNNHPNSADVYVLLCWDADMEDPVASFVIPGHYISVNLRKIDVPRHTPKEYRGKWSRWLGAWAVVADVLNDLRTGARTPLIHTARLQDPIPF